MPITGNEELKHSRKTNISKGDSAIFHSITQYALLAYIIYIKKKEKKFLKQEVFVDFRCVDSNRRTHRGCSNCIDFCMAFV